MNQDYNIIRHIEQFHAEWSALELGQKLGALFNRQREINWWANVLLCKRACSGFFTSEELVAESHLQVFQNELYRQKAEVNQELYNEIVIELMKVLLFS